MNDDELRALLLVEFALLTRLPVDKAMALEAVANRKLAWEREKAQVPETTPDETH